ncbi:NAD(P)H nitroreductase [Dysgonomonas capnocytophagoides]|uniref:NAD(P)H nitroreductase n=1 Tax=Dysgonomonas capnocytophagoides TaxID=45254 RepID=A0A4Y8L7W0_9BACT|nr:nitroreductase family protein [Dysgonomonas capnocytophagoides]TFD98663.1 NAD(P)H nitroreductase [Dysgonomonas capnocytophagoides]
MNSFSELITRRRSIRKFTEELIAPEHVELILKAGLKSPSSKNAKPWHFIVVEDKDLLEKLSHVKKMGCKILPESALSIVVAADPLVSNVWIEDASIASIMMQLQAEDLGLGSCWIQIRDRYNAAEVPSEECIKDLLELPMQLQVLSIIAIGHKGQEKALIDDDKLEWEKVHIGKF